MCKYVVDNGQSFDFGKTSKEYAKHRDIYPEELFDKLYSLGIGKADSNWLDLGTGTGVIPRGLAKYGANITAIDISPEQINEAKLLSGNFTNINYQVCSAEQMNFCENSFDAVTACQCFWYFTPDIIVPKIKSLLRPGGIFLKIYMGHLKDDPIASKSYALVKNINKNYNGASASIKDLTTHYFDNPHMDSFVVDIPFTKEHWHGRIMASRGVMASMSSDMLKHFEQEHLKLLSDLPGEFAIRHKVFLTYYYMNS